MPTAMHQSRLGGLHLSELALAAYTETGAQAQVNCQHSPVRSDDKPTLDALEPDGPIVTDVVRRLDVRMRG